MAYRISTKLLMPISFKKSAMKIDFVSDIACPWCAVGLNALEIALTRIGDDIPVTLHTSVGVKSFIIRFTYGHTLRSLSYRGFGAFSRPLIVSPTFTLFPENQCAFISSA